MAYHAIFYGGKMKIYCILFDAIGKNKDIENLMKSKKLHCGDFITNSWTATTLASMFSGKTVSELAPKGFGYEGTYKNILTDREKKKWDSQMIFNLLPEDWHIHIHSMGPTRGDTNKFKFVPDEICGIDRNYYTYDYNEDVDETGFMREMQRLPNEENHFIFLKYNHYHDSVPNEKLMGIALNRFERIINRIDFKEENSLFWIFSDHGNFKEIDELMPPPDSWLSWCSVIDNIRKKKVTKDLIYMCDFHNTILNRVFKQRRKGDVHHCFDKNRIYVSEDGRRETGNGTKCTSVSAIKRRSDGSYIQTVFHGGDAWGKNTLFRTIVYDGNYKDAMREGTSYFKVPVFYDTSLIRFLKNNIWKWYFDRWNFI